MECQERFELSPSVWRTEMLSVKHHWHMKRRYLCFAPAQGERDVKVSATSLLLVICSENVALDSVLDALVHPKQSFFNVS